MNIVADSARIAAVQMVSTPDLETNLDQAETLIAQAARAGAALAALPENFSLMPLDERDNVHHREPAGGTVQRFLAACATRHRIWIVGGTIPMEASAHGLYRAASLLFDDCGRQVARYDKIHLFDVDVADGRRCYRESRTVEPGDTVVVAETPVGCLGLSVCYDIRFPEMFRRLVDAGAELVSIPSAFTAVTGRAHWDVLVRARAIENQVYVVAPAQGGHHENGRDTHGDTLIVDPWGRVLDRHPLGPGLTMAPVELQALRRLRKEFPCLEHRRLA